MKQSPKGADSSPENDIESAEAANSEKLREALKEIRSRLVENPMYAALTEDEELEIGGETGELSYLVRVADAAIEPTKGEEC